MKKSHTNFRLVLMCGSLFSLISLSSCYKDNEETMYPDNCNTDHVSFSATIQPLLNNNCTACHSGDAPSGGITLTNYADIVNVANSGSLLGTIKHESGFPAMPQGGASLSDCSISQVEEWIRQGTPNN